MPSAERWGRGGDMPRARRRPDHPPTPPGRRRDHLPYPAREGGRKDGRPRKPPATVTTSAPFAPGPGGRARGRGSPGRSRRAAVPGARSSASSRGSRPAAQRTPGRPAGAASARGLTPAEIATRLGDEGSRSRTATSTLPAPPRSSWGSRLRAGGRLHPTTSAPDRIPRKSSLSR